MVVVSTQCGRQHVIALRVHADIVSNAPASSQLHVWTGNCLVDVPPPLLPPPPCLVAVTVGSFRYSGRRFRWLAAGVRASGYAGSNTGQ